MTHNFDEDFARNFDLNHPFDEIIEEEERPGLFARIAQAIVMLLVAAIAVGLMVVAALYVWLWVLDLVGRLP